MFLKQQIILMPKKHENEISFEFLDKNPENPNNYFFLKNKLRIPKFKNSNNKTTLFSEYDKNFLKK